MYDAGLYDPLEEEDDVRKNIYFSFLFDIANDLLLYNLQGKKNTVSFLPCGR